jgi:hypothetical protein
MLDNVGVPDACTVKLRVLLVPPAVVTLMLKVPAVALVETVSVAVNEVAFETFTLLAVTPEGRFRLVPPATKLVPLKVAVKDCPRVPDAGLTVERVGAAGVCTVKLTVLLVPPAVVTLTV